MRPSSSSSGRRAGRAAAPTNSGGARASVQPQRHPPQQPPLSRRQPIAPAHAPAAVAPSLMAAAPAAHAVSSRPGTQAVSIPQQMAQLRQMAAMQQQQSAAAAQSDAALMPPPPSRPPRSLQQTRPQQTGAAHHSSHTGSSAAAAAGPRHFAPQRVQPAAAADPAGSGAFGWTAAQGQEDAAAAQYQAFPPHSAAFADCAPPLPLQQPAHRPQQLRPLQRPQRGRVQQPQPFIPPAGLSAPSAAFHPGLATTALSFGPAEGEAEPLEPVAEEWGQSELEAQQQQQTEPEPSEGARLAADLAAQFPLPDLASMELEELQSLFSHSYFAKMDEGQPKGRGRREGRLSSAGWTHPRLALTLPATAHVNLLICAHMLAALPQRRRR